MRPVTHIYIQICVHIPSIWLNTTLALDLFTLFWMSISFITISYNTISFTYTMTCTKIYKITRMLTNMKSNSTLLSNVPSLQLAVLAS